MSNTFLYQPFVAVSGNLGGKVAVFDDVLSTHEQEIYRFTSTDENCKDFEFQTDRNYYIDLWQCCLGLKLKIVKSSGYETYNSKYVIRKHKEEEKTDQAMEVVEGAPVPLVTRVNNILHSIFPNIEVYINNQQTYNSNRLYAHKSYKSINVKRAFFENKGVSHCECYDYNEFLDEIMEASFFEPFFTRRMNMFSWPDDFMLFANLRIDFFSDSELLYQNMKIRLRPIRARTYFYMISDNPSNGFGKVDCSLYTRPFPLKNEYHKKIMDMLAYTPVEYNYLKTLAKTFIIPARQNHFNQGDIFNKAAFVELPLQWIRSLHSGIVYWKYILVSTIRVQTNWNTQRRSVNRKRWCRR